MPLQKGFDYEKFVTLMDQNYDEIFIWDKHRKIVYANYATHRHYGIAPEEFVGKTLHECTVNEKLWSPTCVPLTFQDKRPVIQRQKTFLGIDIVTISVPILDEEGNVEFVLQSVRDVDDDLFKMLRPLTLNTEEAEDMHVETIIYKSTLMKDTLKFANKIAGTKAPVLILGETGTGKSLIAKYIHEKSPRKEKPFISINIASLSPTVIESELFGYQKGAFTGAEKSGKIGIFEGANGGSFFLDDIGELPYDLQAKFLHVLQEEAIIPVGSHKPIQLDIHIICATNCDLQNMVEAGKFREDLYHRLNVFDIMMPPLRKRQEDIEPLSAYFLHLFNKKYGRSLTISSRVMELFHQYPWKGNIRELSNVIERAVLTAEGTSIEINHLPESFFRVDNIKNHGCPLVSQKLSLEEAMERYERTLIQTAYQTYGSSRKMAKYLKISQTKANRLIRKYVRNEENAAL